MTKLLISKATEAKAVAIIWNMAAESLDPDSYTGLVAALEQMCETRAIDNEVIAVEHIILSRSNIHASDCGTSNAPAEVPEPCNC